VSKDPGVWIEVFCMLAIFSFLYKENPVYRFAEHLYVGIAAGHAVLMGWGNVRNIGLSALAEGRFLSAVPLLLGLLMFARFNRRISWLARYPVATLVGTGTGLILRRVPAIQIIAQVQACFVSLASINNLIIVVGVLGTLAYFLFTQKHEGGLGVLANIGKWSMMVAFGAGFGNTAFSYLSLLVGSLTKILGTWLGLMG
jgi:hypothetical protein